MRYLNPFLYIIFLIGFSITFGQRENENWTFGYNKWNFNYSTGNLIASSLPGSVPIISEFQGSATYSDPNNGSLLFYTDGYNVFNKNHQLMENGDNLYGSSADAYYMRNQLMFGGNGFSALQPVIIVPKPGSSSIYYIFLNGNYDSHYAYFDEVNPGDEYYNNYLSLPNFGLRYAIVDLSFNSGLGKVVSKNNLLLSDISRGLTSTVHSDGASYWLVTGKGSNFYSYKISSSGISTTPIISSAPYIDGIIKVSPNSKLVFSGGALYNFNNSTGVLSNPNLLSIYETTKFSSYAEFSPNSNLLYMSSGFECLCVFPHQNYNDTGLSVYNIQTGQVIGYSGATPEFPFPNNGFATASLQLANNGKIYLTFSTPFHFNAFSMRLIETSNQWAVIENPDIWNPSINPMSTVYTNSQEMSISFPQTIPLQTGCIENLNITTPITSSEDFQVSNTITASSVINPGVTVNFKANEIFLEPGFSVSAKQRSLFTAFIDPCTTTSRSKENFGKEERNSVEFTGNIDVNSPILSPNPTEAYLNIDNSEDILEWKLVDIYGTTKMSGNNNSLQYRIVMSIDGLTPGIYYFNAVMKDGKLFKKAIIKK